MCFIACDNDWPMGEFNFSCHWRDKTLIFERKKTMISFVHKQTSDALQYPKKAFLFISVFFSAALLLISYIFCHWFLISLLHAKVKVYFQANLQEKSYPNVKLSIKDSYSLLKQKVSVAPSLSSNLHCLIMILFKEAQEVKKSQPRRRGGGRCTQHNAQYALFRMTNIL